MARADFNWIPFTHTFTANDPTFTAEFRVEGDPIDDAYLLIRLTTFRRKATRSSSTIRTFPAGTFRYMTPAGRRGWIILNLGSCTRG